MPATFTTPLVTAATDDLITAAAWNNEFTNLYNNLTPGGIDDYSSTDGEMQTTTDPYPGSVVSRPTSSAGELERIRYQINQIIGKTYWYQDPSLSLEALKSAFLITGEIRSYAGDSAPSGWLLCDGAAVSRTTYVDLFSLVGTRFGQGNGVTTFNIPDLRGKFLRGRDAGATNDPDSSSRTAMATGGATGDAVGSVQGTATKRPNTPFTTDNPGDHNHSNGAYSRLLKEDGLQTFNSADAGANEPNLSASGAIAAGGAHTHTITGGGDNESRPPNVYVNYIIKT